MNKKIGLLAAAFFCLGLTVALATRLLMSSDGHQHGASALEVQFNILQQPLQDVHGKATSLADVMVNDKAVLVNFWATWCTPCLREMPLLQQAQAQHGIKTVGISYEDIGTINAFVARTPVSYPLYKSSFDIFYFFQQQGNNIAVMPYTVLIDEEGEVAKAKVGDFRTVAEIVEFAGQ